MEERYKYYSISILEYNYILGCLQSAAEYIKDNGDMFGGLPSPDYVLSDVEDCLLMMSELKIIKND